ncbi:MAG: hypothetical protein KKE79_05160 [Actinobacteria bacterium]|nr:hypothetical protein [Actinomycetota bacterium]MBU4240573.1 hypothetical protein [Actinomycetota bacterium]MBU4302131.1 hypothetical protein [Actinomycetota bacterium]MBU4490005.1 hypothetical protein [Actinomycetota bacterium]MCG2794960.1 hypothetical protein [Actinomycetes bacterium]
MGYLKLCCVAPHAPILVPEVGGSELGKIESSSRALDALAAQIRDIGPETIVIVSPPHISLSQDKGFDVKTGEGVNGSLSRFGAPQVAVRFTVDDELVESIAQAAGPRDISLVGDESTGEQDWGVLVPLRLLAPATCRLVSIRVSPYLPYRDHYYLGIAIREGVKKVARNAVFIASGDFSHRLTRGAPSGYNPRGKEFDAEIVDIIGTGEFNRLFEMDPGLIESAGEDCLWSVAVLAGTVDGYRFDSEVLSYEGPFGVGYMVARVIPGKPDPEKEMTPP